MPTCSKLDRYECLHGLGYTKISSEKDGMLCETNYFIPIDTLLEIWKVTLNNSRDQAADLDLFSCVEFALWDAWEDFTELWAFRGTRNKIHVKRREVVTMSVFWLTAGRLRGRLSRSC